MEFILDNLGVFVFLVLAVGVRVLQAKAKAKARKNQKPEPQVFASALEPDEDDDEPRYRLEPDEDETPRPTGGKLEGLVDYARTRGASAYTIEKARSLLAKMAEDKPRFEVLPGLPPPDAPADRPAAANFPAARSPAEQAASFTPADAPFQAAPEGVSPSGRVSEGPKKSGALLPGLEKLSPLQQAIIWAEILGKPQGIT
jgi:hypothetical protein